MPCLVSPDSCCFRIIMWGTRTFGNQCHLFAFASVRQRRRYMFSADPPAGVSCRCEVLLSLLWTTTMMTLHMTLQGLAPNSVTIVDQSLIRYCCSYSILRQGEADLVLVALLSLLDLRTRSRRVSSLPDAIAGRCQPTKRNNHAKSSVEWSVVTAQTHAEKEAVFDAGV